MEQIYISRKEFFIQSTRKGCPWSLSGSNYPFSDLKGVFDLSDRADIHFPADHGGKAKNPTISGSPVGRFVLEFWRKVQETG